MKSQKLQKIGHWFNHKFFIVFFFYPIKTPHKDIPLERVKISLHIAHISFISWINLNKNQFAFWWSLVRMNPHFYCFLSLESIWTKINLHFMDFVTDIKLDKKSIRIFNDSIFDPIKIPLKMPLLKGVKMNHKKIWFFF